MFFNCIIIISHLASLLNATVTKTHLQEFEDFSKTALLFSTLAITLSHCFFALALIYHVLPKKWEKICNCIIFYNIRDLKKTQDPEQVRATPGSISGSTPGLTPGSTSGSTSGSTPEGSTPGATPGATTGATSQETRDDYIMCERNCHFILAVIVSLILLVILVIVFFYGQYQYHYRLSSHETNSIGQIAIFYLELFAEISYVLSLIFTLGNCFYFSNLMYSIQNGCEDQEKLLTDNPPQDGPNTIGYLTKKDEDFVNNAVDKLGLFQLWFLIHWIFYIISSFLSLALLLEAIVLHVKAVLPHVEDGVRFAPVDIYVFCGTYIFAVISVTRTRERLIRKIFNSHYDCTPEAPPENVKKEYVDFMKRQKFGFRLRILCASIPFNLNVAYISFVVGLVGVVISLIFSF